MRSRRFALDEQGSAPVEFVLVGALLTALTLAVIQFGLAVYVRNVVHDAAVEGAYTAARADMTLESGVDRTREIVARTVGVTFASDVSVESVLIADQPSVAITVVTTLPLAGLLGVPRGLEVTAHAPSESLE